MNEWGWHNYAAGSLTLSRRGVPQSFTLFPDIEYAAGIDGDVNELRDYLNALEARATATEADHATAVALDAAEAKVFQLEDRIAGLEAKLAAAEARLQVAVDGLEAIENLVIPLLRSNDELWELTYGKIKPIALQTLAALDAARDGTAS